MPYFEPSPSPGTSPPTTRNKYTLHAISKPHLFVQHYPEIAAVAREFVRHRPGIGEYRFVCGHISADANEKAGRPIATLITLESATRHLAIRLVLDEQGIWIPSISSDEELKPWERRGPR